MLKTQIQIRWIVINRFYCIYFSGNGKRSGPPTDLSKNNENDQLLLKKILLQNSDINNYGIDDFDITPIDPLEEQYKSGYNGLEDLKTLSDLVQELVSKR